MSKGVTMNFGSLNILGLVLVGLKLTEHIDWSWFWVTMPFWIGAVFLVPFAVVWFGYFGALFLAALLWVGLGVLGLLEELYYRVRRWKRRR